MLNYGHIRMNILCGKLLLAKQMKMYICTLKNLYSGGISCRLYRILSWNDIEQELLVFIHICE